MYFIKLSTLEYPRHIGDIWLDHPELEGKYECPETYAKVTETQPPEYDAQLQRAELDTPTQKNGEWIMTWKVVNYTQEELDAIAKSQAEFETQNNI